MLKEKKIFLIGKVSSNIKIFLKIDIRGNYDMYKC